MSKKLFSLLTLASVMMSASAATTVTLWESPTPEGVQLDWGGRIEDAVVSPAKCADWQVGDKVEITVVKYDPTIDAWPQVLLKCAADWADMTPGQVMNDKEVPHTFTFEFDADLLDWAKEGGFYPSGIAVWISKMVYVPVNGSSAVEEVEAAEADAPVDVYSIQGVLVKRQVAPAAALEGLRPGLYIVGGKKVLVK